ncbi:hypothetical protein D3C71_1752790 [compost metagenome]
MLGGSQVAANCQALELERGRRLVVADKLHLEAIGAAVELGRRAFAVASDRQLHARKVQGVAVGFVELERRQADVAVDAAVIAKAGLRSQWRLATCGSEPRGGVVILLQRAVADRHDRHQLERLDP